MIQKQATWFHIEDTTNKDREYKQGKFQTQDTVKVKTGTVSPVLKASHSL